MPWSVSTGMKKGDTNREKEALDKSWPFGTVTLQATYIQKLLKGSDQGGLTPQQESRVRYLKQTGGRVQYEYHVLLFVSSPIPIFTGVISANMLIATIAVIEKPLLNMTSGYLGFQFYNPICMV